MYNVIDADYRKKLVHVVRQEMGIELEKTEQTLVRTVAAAAVESAITGTIMMPVELETSIGASVSTPTPISKEASSVELSTGSSATGGTGSSHEIGMSEAIDLASVSVGPPATEQDHISDGTSESGSLNNTSLDITQIISQIAQSSETLDKSNA